MITAIDVGATKTLLCQFDQHGEPIHKQRFLTPHSFTDFWQQIQTRLDKLQTISSITIAVPGVVANGVLLKCGILPWKNVPLEALLSESYNCPVFAENDAKLAAYYEINALPQPVRMGIYITVSTGIGVGVIMDGELLPQLDYSEPGHMAVEFEGKIQIWQDFASGRSIARHFNHQASELHSENQWREVAKRVSVGLHALIPSFQPNVIVFGGGLGKFIEKFEPYLKEELTMHMSPYITMPELRVAAHPNDTVLYGCYRYATHEPTP